MYFKYKKKLLIKIQAENMPLKRGHWDAWF